MKQLRKRLTYANVMSSFAVFLVLGGTTAFAASQLGKNSVGAKQLKKNAVTAAKIKKGAVTGAKIKLDTLGTVPSAATAASAASATTAATANSLAGQTTFSVRLGFGQQQTIAANGAVSLVASCSQEAGVDTAEVLFQTSVNGAVAGGEENYDGSAPTEFLNVDTPAELRPLADVSEVSGDTFVVTDTDEGFVFGPEGKGLVANSDGIILALNYGGLGCRIAGVVNAVG